MQLGLAMVVVFNLVVVAVMTSTCPMNDVDHLWAVLRAGGVEEWRVRNAEMAQLAMP